MTEMLRMPISFGPSLGPRQGPAGRDFQDQVLRKTLFTVPLLADADRLAGVLPPGFEPAEVPRVTFRFHYNENVHWLAGRGYNYLEVMFATVFRGEHDEAEGDLTAVMWESLADPIITGREEVGLPKLFADIPEPTREGGSSVLRVSWEGFEFVTAELAGLEYAAWPSAVWPDAAEQEAPARRGVRLNYKYIPNSDDLTQADVAYVTATPQGGTAQQLVESWSGPASLTVHRAAWEDLPTFVQVVNSLADLNLRPDGPATMTRALVAFDSLRDAMRVLR